VEANVMRRLLLCLPLCFVLLPGNPRADSASKDVPPPKVSDDGSALPDDAAMERLARTDPIAFLENCVRRYDREVKGYRCTLQMQERIDGKLRPTEVIDVRFREKPFSVLLDWRSGAGLAQRTLYVKGRYHDEVQVLPAGIFRLAGVVARDPEGKQARQSGRYPLTEFGIEIGTRRALAAMKAARRRGSLRVEYLGEVRVKEAGNRLCWGLRRTGYEKPEPDGFTPARDGITQATFYFDKETWLQVGSILKGEENRLIGEYFFRDIQLNPEFKPGTFTPEALKR
jgi:hypothetical protein